MDINLNAYILSIPHLLIFFNLCSVNLDSLQYQKYQTIV